MKENSSKDFRSILLAKKQSLLSLQETRKQSGEVVSLDQTRTGRLSRMDALQGQAMALESDARAARELQSIESALARISADEFGDCLECGESIAEARLAANPTTTFCLACATAREQ